MTSTFDLLKLKSNQTEHPDGVQLFFSKYSVHTRPPVTDLHPTNTQTENSMPLVPVGGAISIFELLIQSWGTQFSTTLACCCTGCSVRTVLMVHVFSCSYQSRKYLTDSITRKYFTLPSNQPTINTQTENLSLLN